MEYNFDKIVNRMDSSQRALNWDLAKHVFGNKVTHVEQGYSLIPMWVADMSFATAPFIKEALKQRIDEDTFGYFYLDDSYYKAIIEWQQKRHHLTGIQKEWIGFCNGVVGGVCAALAMDGNENDPVLINTPCYIGFKKSAKFAKRTLIESELVLDETGIWRMNYEDMEAKIKQYGIKKMIFCNPHNPSGRVWEKEELEKVVEIALKYDVLIIDDEIWSDIISKQHTFTSLLSIKGALDHIIYLSAGSKTFSIAGLTGSYDIVPNSKIKQRFEEFKEKSAFNKPNALSVVALKAGYNEGECWVEALNDVITHNLKTMYDYLKTVEGFELILPQGTYMLYVDCTRYCQIHRCDLDDVLAKGVKLGVLWQDGRPFGHPCSIRINVALPKPLLLEAIQRLKTVL